MTTAIHHIHIAAAVKPLVSTSGLAGAAWLVLNAISFVCEALQWLQRRAEATKVDRGSLRVLLICAAIGIAILVAAPIDLPGAAIRPASVSFALGFTLFLGGFAMRRWSEHTLGRYFTFAVMTSGDQPVITSGPYRYVRHPGYTGVMLIVVGAGLVSGNWIGLAAFTVCVLLPLLYRIQVEEGALAAALDDYRDYAARHKRLIPLVW
jgi:protein-S-isoprenylcysteine O-methyltransferase Ste14